MWLPVAITNVSYICIVSVPETSFTITDFAIASIDIAVPRTNSKDEGGYSEKPGAISANIWEVSVGLEMRNEVCSVDLPSRHQIDPE